MERELERRGYAFEIIQTEQEHPRTFYSLEFHPDLRDQGSSPRSIGLCASRTGIEPQLLVDPAAALLYVGIDASILIINHSAALVKRLDLPSPFYWMTLFNRLTRILVVHEIGLLCLDSEGSIVWRHDTADIISFISLRAANTLEVKLLEGGTTSLDLKTGEGPLDV
jgi:hypothetical protein